MKLLDRYQEVVGQREIDRLRHLAAGLASSIGVNSTKPAAASRDPLLDDPCCRAEESTRDEVVSGPPDSTASRRPFTTACRACP
jgi:hypothetical protein